MSYAELVCASHYSFLRGASSPGDLIRTALQLGYSGLGLCDRNSMAGVVRALSALEEIAQGPDEDSPVKRKDSDCWPARGWFLPTARRTSPPIRPIAQGGGGCAACSASARDGRKRAIVS